MTSDVIYFSYIVSYIILLLVVVFLFLCIVDEQGKWDHLNCKYSLYVLVLVLISVVYKPSCDKCNLELHQAYALSWTIYLHAYYTLLVRFSVYFFILLLM